MAQRLRIGGGAQFDGVAIRSERFSATVRCIEGDEPHCELAEKELECLPGWLESINRIPLLRGALLPLFVWWQTRSSMPLTDGETRKASLSEKITGLIVLLVVFAPFVWIANAWFQPGLLANLVAIAPILFVFGGGIAWLRKCAPDALKYHGAEHKAVSMYDETGEPPDAAEAAIG